MTLLGAVQERGKRFETYLKEADDAVRNQLLATWKELILEEMVELFAITDDPQVLRYLDSNIALGQEITRGKKMMVTIDRAVTASGSVGNQGFGEAALKAAKPKPPPKPREEDEIEIAQMHAVRWRRGGDSNPRYPY